MRFRALDGFRGLCALIVALYHFPVYSHLTTPDFFLPNAQMLLDFFFVMSGFIISASYGDKLKTGADLRLFVIRRFARLWPLHAAVLGGFVTIEIAKAVLAPHAGVIPPFTGPHTPLGILSSLFLVHSLHIHPMLVWNAPSWTVSVEFYTYFIYGALVVAWPRWSVLTATAMALVGVLGIAYVSQNLAANYDWGIFRCWSGFFCGVLVWHLWRGAAPVLATRPALATCLEATVTVAVFAFMATWGGPPTGLAGPLVFAVFIAIYASEAGWVTALLRWPALVWLGEISYSIYLVHYLVIVVIDIGLRSLERFGHVDLAAHGLSGLDDNSLVRFQSKAFMDGASVVFLVLVVAISAQTFRLIEEPGRRLFGRRRVHGSGQPAVARSA